MLLAGIQAEFGLDPRLKHSRVTVLGVAFLDPSQIFEGEREVTKNLTIYDSILRAFQGQFVGCRRPHLSTSFSFARTCRLVLKISATIFSRSSPVTGSTSNLVFSASARNAGSLSVRIKAWRMMRTCS